MIVSLRGLGVVAALPLLSMTIASPSNASVSCPCFSAAMIDAMFQSIDSSFNQPVDAECSASETTSRARLDLASQVSPEAGYVEVRDHRCKFVSDVDNAIDDFHIDRRRISDNESHACWFELVGSGAWNISGCPTDE